MIRGVNEAGGVGSETGALTNALARNGTRDPRTQLPATEALLLGISGGIGFHLAAVGTGSDRRPILDGSSIGLSARATRVEQACAVLGVESAILEGADDLAAENILVEAIQNGRAVLVWVDQASMAHHRLPPGFEGTIPRLVGVLSFDEAAEEFLLDDGAWVGVPVDAQRLRSARSQVSGANNRIVVLRAQRESPAFAPLALEQLSNAMAGLRSPPIGNRGVRGMRNLANQLRARPRPLRGRGHRASFIDAHPPGSRLFVALSALYRFVELGPQGPALGRRLWTETLSEFAHFPGLSILEAEIEAWEDIANRWTRFAEACLPAEIRRLAEARQLLRGQAERYRAHGLDAMGLIGSSHARLQAAAIECEAEFPLDEPQIRFLLDDLAARLDDLALLEQAAAERTIAIMS